MPVLGPTLVHKTDTFFCPAIISLIGESLRVPILGAKTVPVSGTLFGLKTDPVLCPSCFLNAGLGTCRGLEREPLRVPVIIAIDCLSAVLFYGKLFRFLSSLAAFKQLRAARQKAPYDSISAYQGVIFVLQADRKKAPYDSYSG